MTRFDPYSVEARTDPAESYRWLRDHHPLYFIAEYDLWIVSRFEDVWRLMGDPSLPFQGREVTHMTRAHLLMKNEGAVPPDGLDRIAAFPNVDPPHQGTLRGLVNRPFRPGQVAKLEPWFRAMVRRDLPGLLATGRFNLTDAIGQWSARTMCHLAGLPQDAAPRVRTLVNAASTRVGDPSAPPERTALAELFGLVSAAVAERRAAGADGACPFIDPALTGRLAGRALDDAQVTAQLMTPLVGGVETLPKVAAHGLWELAKHPRQLAEVRADLERNVPRAFEEMTRFCAPAQSFHRTVTERVEVMGEVLLPGQRIGFLTASAARDPREFPDPDEFRWDRRIERNLAFGRGDHFCMGVHLARMEGTVVVQEFLAAVPEYEIDEANARRTVSNFQQGWDQLPVVINGGDR